MGNTQYLSTLTIFFFSYAVFEVQIWTPLLWFLHLLKLQMLQVPSNLFLKRLRPSIWLSGLMLLWVRPNPLLISMLRRLPEPQGVMMVRGPNNVGPN